MVIDKKELESYKRTELFTVAKKYNLKGLTLLSKSKIIEKILKAVEKTDPTGPKTPPQKIQEDTYQQGETKYYSPGSAQQSWPTAASGELPEEYGDNRIVLMVRDPWWLYSYWDVAPAKHDEVRRQMSSKANGARLIIRVYDVTEVNFDGTNAWKSFDIEIGSAANWYINVGAGNRSYIVDMGYLATDGSFYLIARSNCVTTPPEGISDVVDEEWMTVDYHKIYALSGGFGRNVGSEALKEMMERRLREELSSGGMSGASWTKKAEKARGFWLVADAELIVYGATDPEAKLTVQGKPVKLRKDGTFSLRYALPDGKQEIPIAAISPDGVETRTITPIVQRETQ